MSAPDEETSAAAEQASLAALFGRMGAGPAQAATLATQLRKRCDQLATARGWTREEAMRHLLTVLVKGHAGETVPGFEGRAASRVDPGPGPAQADAGQG